MIPTSIDGTDITGATIDGQDVQEITVDGQTVFSAAPVIPDSQDLQARYDFTKENGTVPITDQTNNGNDLDQGGYSGVSVTINGVQAGDFDGTDDIAQTNWSALSQPYSIFIVYEYRTTNDFDRLWSDFDLSPLVEQELTGRNEWRVNAGSSLEGGTPDTSPHVSSIVINGANSIHRIDQSQVASGDAGTNSLEGFSIGAQGDGTNFSDVKLGEILIYTNDKSGKFFEIESYLSDKWGPF